MLQIELFDPERYGSVSGQFMKILRTKGIPAFKDRARGEDHWIGSLVEMQDLAISAGTPEMFDRFMADYERLGGPSKSDRSKMPAKRLRDDPRTSKMVQHLFMLDQVVGYMNGTSASRGRMDSLPDAPSTPNRMASPLDLGDLRKGGKVSPNTSGQVGEASITAVLDSLGIRHWPQWKAPFHGWGKKSQSVIDFKVEPFNDPTLDKGFYIEAKWRNRVGSIDDSLTALIHNIESWYDLPTLVVYDGEGAVDDAYEIISHQMRLKKRKLDKLMGVVSFSQFVSFANRQLGKQSRGVG